MRGLKDKVIVVAGGGTGLGAATAQRLAEEGAKVVIGDLSAEKAQQVAARLESLGACALGIPFDMVVDDSVRALIAVAAVLCIPARPQHSWASQSGWPTP